MPQRVPVLQRRRWSRVGKSATATEYAPHGVSIHHPDTVPAIVPLFLKSPIFTRRCLLLTLVRGWLSWWQVRRAGTVGDGGVDGVVGVFILGLVGGWGCCWGERIEGNLLDVWKGGLSEEVVGILRGEAL